jgi:hypothetical protein
MRSTVISPSKQQLTLELEPGLTDTYRSAKECVAAGVYRRGLGNIAIDLNKAPGNLSVELSDDPTRHFSLDSFEAYLEKTKDFTALYYLIEKHLSDKTVRQDAARDEALAALAGLAPLLKKAGLV